MKKKQGEKMQKTTQVLFFVNAAVWLVFGVLGFFRVTGMSNLRLILSILMVANAAVMFGFGLLILRGHPKIYFLAILYVAVNVVLSITDQFGWIDALTLLLNLILLGMLFVTRQRMNQIENLSEG